MVHMTSTKVSSIVFPITGVSPQDGRQYVRHFGFVSYHYIVLFSTSCSFLFVYLVHS
jgi:hypothetical protein